MTNIAGLGVDPGWRWTGAVLVVDGLPVDGFTIGPTDADGRPFREAHDDMDDVALGRYTERIGAHLDHLYDKATALGCRVLVSVERPTPVYGKKRFVSKLRAYQVTRDVSWYVRGHYYGVVPYRFDQDHPHGKRHLEQYGGTGKLFDHYPRDLCWRRPKGWLVNEEPDTSRDHERSAFDIATRRLAQFFNTDVTRQTLTATGA